MDTEKFGGIAKDYLTTTYLDAVLPGIAAKYGKDVPVTLGFKSGVAPNSFFNPNEVGMKMTAIIEFIVNGETAVVLSVTDADALVSPKLENFTLFVDILKFMIKTVSVKQSLIPDI